MKKLLAIVAIASFTACGTGQQEPPADNGSEVSSSGSAAAEGANPTGPDSVKRAADSAMQTGDTSALNAERGDSTSASGIHGKGSGSRVGGGKTAEPQGKSSKQ